MSATDTTANIHTRHCPRSSSEPYCHTSLLALFIYCNL